MAKKTKKKYTSIGGQALMEGIMMRGPQRTVMCVRRADGTILTEDVKQSKQSIWNKIPLIRGVVGFVQSMMLGTKTLMRSADIAIEDEMAAEERKEQELAQAQIAPEAPCEDEKIAEISECAADGAICNGERTEEIAESNTGNAVQIEENAETTEIELTATTQAAPDASEKCVEPTEPAKPAELTESAKPTRAQARAAAKQAKLDAKAAAKQAKVDAKAAAKQAKLDAKEAAIKAKEDEKIAKVAERNPKKAEKLRKKAEQRAKKLAERKKQADSDNGFLLFCSTVLGFGFAILLFFFLPTWIVDGMLGWLFPLALPEETVQRIVDNGTVWRPIFEGIIKMIIFIIYIALCSRLNEIKRIFQYHGAEHKTIFCYEAGEELTVENVRRFRRFHPRCGTSFLILMLIVGIAAGVAAKSFLPEYIANSRLWYPLIKLGLIPAIMGVGYELLKFAGKHDNILTRIISAPGMWMQRLTTKEPSDDQIECAIAALVPVIPENGEDMA